MINAVDYVYKAHAFMMNPPPGTLSLKRTNGDLVFYDPKTETLAIKDASGAPKTFFKPDPAKHGHPTNLEYFRAQQW